MISEENFNEPILRSKEKEHVPNVLDNHKLMIERKEKKIKKTIGSHQNTC